MSAAKDPEAALEVEDPNKEDDDLKELTEDTKVTFLRTMTQSLAIIISPYVVASVLSTYFYFSDKDAGEERI